MSSETAQQVVISQKVECLSISIETLRCYILDGAAQVLIGENVLKTLGIDVEDQLAALVGTGEIKNDGDDLFLEKQIREAGTAATVSVKAINRENSTHSDHKKVTTRTAGSGGENGAGQPLNDDTFLSDADVVSSIL